MHAGKIGRLTERRLGSPTRGSTSPQKGALTGTRKLGPPIRGRTPPRNSDVSWLKRLSPLKMEKYESLGEHFRGRYHEGGEEKLFEKHIKLKTKKRKSPSKSPISAVKNALFSIFSPAQTLSKTSTRSPKAIRDWIVLKTDRKTGKKLWAAYDYKAKKDMLIVSASKPPSPSLVSQTHPYSPLEWRIRPQQNLFSHKK